MSKADGFYSAIVVLHAIKIRTEAGAQRDLARDIAHLYAVWKEGAEPETWAQFALDGAKAYVRSQLKRSPACIAEAVP